MDKRIQRYRWNPRRFDKVWCLTGIDLDCVELLLIVDIEQEEDMVCPIYSLQHPDDDKPDAERFAGRTLEQLRVHKREWCTEEDEVYMCKDREQALRLLRVFRRE